MATMVQLNVRMKPELKAAGDSVLELYGVSPSEVIRALWEKISLGEEAFAQVVKAFAADPAVGSARSLVRNPDAPHFASMVRRRQESFEREVGLDPSTYVPIDAEELDDLVYEDYLEKRGSHDAG